jgi:hypothetical protein
MAMKNDHWLNKISIELMYKLDNIPYSEDMDQVKSELIKEYISKVPEYIMGEAHKNIKFPEPEPEPEPPKPFDISKLSSSVLKPSRD